ncbi:MAG: hypothetical protein ACFFBD_04760 [Candidatus Hodarchaeota archaeon]
MTVDRIGRFQSEGRGEINWKDVEIVKYNKKERIYKVAIRKGLPHSLTEEQQKLLKMSLLHDFVPTEKHRSKIYKEIDVGDKEFIELLKTHHEESNDPLIQQLQKYDRIASIGTRKV